MEVFIIEIAVTLFTLRDFTKTQQDIEQTLKKLKKIGYKYVQISAIGAIASFDLRKMLDNTGLVACAAHVPYDKLKNCLPEVIKEHNIIGCRHIAIGALPNEMRNEEGYIQFAKEGSTIAKTLAEEGFTFSYHNHWWELDKFHGRSGLEIIFDESNPELLFAEIDTAWIKRGGADPVEWIGKMKGREPLVHLKDLKYNKNEPEAVEVGEGTLDWEEILKACHQSGVEWLIIEQDYCLDPFKSVLVSLNNLKALIKKSIMDSDLSDV